MNPRGQLDLLLLAGLQRQQPVHGYALIGSVRELSADAFDLAEGTVYPALRRLESQGWVDSTWDDNSPRQRRLYRLTHAGRQALREKRRDWAGFSVAVNAVVTASLRAGPA
jgi:PadR family transcriptional regulator, regulatory protein PadR